MASRLSLTRSLLTAALAVAMVAAVLAGATFSKEGADATHKPADKMAVAGSTLEVLTDELTVGANTDTATLLEGTMRTSSPTDLLFQVTLECALWTHVATTGNDEAASRATVKVWVEVDGEPVRIASDDLDDDGKVVFCDRAHRMETLQFDDEDATIKHFLSTRTANAFNWMSLNVGNGIHEITVKAELDTAVDGTGAAKAGIGKRMLVVEPTKLANDATL